MNGEDHLRETIKMLMQTQKPKHQVHPPLAHLTCWSIVVYVLHSIHHLSDWKAWVAIVGYLIVTGIFRRA